MGNKRNKSILSIFLSMLLILSMSINVPRAMAVQALTIPGYASGADVSWIPQMEASGFVFRDENGNVRDCLDILKEKGIDSIRLRTWVNPSNDPQAGHCSTLETVAMAKRVVDKGFRLMIDFHYSDSWADPGKQVTPAAWQNDNIDQLTTHVYDYTLEVMNALKAEGITPEWVQVGNEINPGMMLPLGAEGDFVNLTRLINAGYDAVKAVAPNAKVIIHRANGDKTNEFQRFFDGLTAKGAKYDIIGCSVYPGSNYMTYMDNLRINLNNLVNRYNKEVMVVEIGGEASNPTASYNMIIAARDIVQSIPNNKGLGVFYWEPQGAQSWSGYALSAWNGYNTPSQPTDGQPTIAMNAFIPGATQINPVPVTGLTLDKTSVSMEVGATTKLTAIVEPSNATFNMAKFSSSNEATAKIDPNGNVVGVSVGTATITATTYDNSKSVQCQVTVNPSTALVTNSSFELGTSGWTVTGSGISLGENNGYDGSTGMHYYSGQPFNGTVSQTISNIPNGSYKLTAMSQGGGGETNSEVFATLSNGQKLASNFTNIGWQNWVKTTVNDIQVTDGTLTVGFYINAPGGVWGDIDALVLAKTDGSTLTDLKVNGVTVKGFDSETLTYNVVLPAGTTLVPEVTATKAITNATAVVTPATVVPGQTKVVVTAEDGITTKTYTINFTVANPNPIQNPGFEDGYTGWTITDETAVSSSNDKRSDSKALGYWKSGAFTVTASQVITGLQNGTYSLSAWSQGGGGENTVQIFATNAQNVKATADFTNTGWCVWSKATIPNIEVTDGTLTIGAYVDGKAGNWGGFDDFELIQTSVSESKSTDATLSDLKVNGATVAGFDSNNTSYRVELPAGTTAIPEVIAAVTAMGKATAVLTPAASLPGQTTVAVIAEDGTTTKTYTIDFTVAAATLVQNPGFENGYTGWTITDATAVNESKDAKAGSKALGYWKDGDFTVAASQVITGLQNGTYSLSAWAQGSGGENKVQIFATNSQNVKATADFTNTGWGAWTNAIIENIEVTNGTLTIGAYVDGNSGNWGSFDEFQLVQTSVATPKSSDATLSDLKVNGTTVTGFESNTTAYRMELPSGTTTVPTVLGTVTATGKATAVVTPATNLPGQTTVEVTAEDGTTTKSYTINFTVAVVVPDPTPDNTIIPNTDLAAVLNAVKNAGEKSTVMVDVSSNKEISKEIFAAIQGQDKTVTFVQDGVQWSFNGKDITEEIKAIDMTVVVDSLTDTKSANKDGISKLVGDNDTLVISFAENGVLPGKATVRVKLDSAWLQGKDTNNLSIYYYNETTGKAELIAEGLKVDADGYVQFEITHNSDYFVVDKQIADTVTVVTDSNSTSNVSTVVLPQTGSQIDYTVLMSIGALVLLCGVAMIGLRRKSKQK
ncbi:glycosyl hydrolase 53 family protein [Clostridium cellulovorans]|uniref:Arabinogalactan endo-beta-1,4-galactanase n=2 Tax=Clostridium cellulovorans TaxID=1493 RepID=D9SW64_CLOC7|nr:glycosyl hydrolase 53 family protein [Clostridium cellulovorans]ADL51208.1 LPXTG-motif cell wall anchor domain protein [Clostridium cellulovorans 743B]